MFKKCENFRKQNEKQWFKRALFNIYEQKETVLECCMQMLFKCYFAFYLQAQWGLMLVIIAFVLVLWRDFFFFATTPIQILQNLSCGVSFSWNRFNNVLQKILVHTEMIELHSCCRFVSCESPVPAHLKASLLDRDLVTLESVWV